LARRNRSSESRIVVLICQGIYARHQYVKSGCRCPCCGRNIVAVSGRRIIKVIYVMGEHHPYTRLDRP
jgi:hypothetical protein